MRIFFDYYSEGYDFRKGAVYKFGDEEIGNSASYAIDYFSLYVFTQVSLSESYYYSPFYNHDEANTAIDEIINDFENPITVRMNSLKKITKK